MLHKDDLSLLDRLDAPAKETVPFGMADLVTLRTGELVRDDVLGTLTPLEGECVKLAPSRGRTDWECRFLVRMPDALPGRDAGCAIYGRRPSQCRALNCSDTRGIAELYAHDRASRADVMRAVGAPEEWLGLFPAYEEMCAYSRIAPLAKLVMPPINPGTPAEKEATELIKSIDFVYAERVDMAMTDYFQVLTPERWKYLCHYETTETENGGYKLTYYNEDVPVLTLEARYYDGEDQPLDSVWQGYLGRIETVDGKKYDLLSTISQYSKDASDEWKEMYDTYLDVINGIRIMDGCSLTEGSHA